MPDDQPRAAAAGLLDRLQALLGPSGLLSAPGDLAPHLADWRGLYRGSSPFLLRPASTAELAEAVRLCAEAGVALVPQGGNTSMVGGATPDASGAQVPVSLSRLNRVRDVDPVDMTMTAEAGVVLKAAQDAAAAEGCLFPLSLGAEG
ncbi:MAG: FAD-binding oxidoreductase, partial [Acetobacteraceae bacterium]|nr:FAD-binding oxidoreductase [Acetobacteraceae bacterium]